LDLFVFTHSHYCILHFTAYYIAIPLSYFLYQALFTWPRIISGIECPYSVIFITSECINKQHAILPTLILNVLLFFLPSHNFALQKFLATHVWVWLSC
jgi:hypothetical protein